MYFIKANIIIKYQQKIINNILIIYLVITN